MGCPVLCVGGLLWFSKLSCLGSYWGLLWIYAWGLWAAEPALCHALSQHIPVSDSLLPRWTSPWLRFMWLTSGAGLNKQLSGTRWLLASTGAPGTG